MDLGIKGKRALVIGASKNSGRAVAHRLQDEGCHVIAVARSKCDLFPCVQIDMLQPGAVNELISHVGDDAPDIIVHVMGGTLNVRDPFATKYSWSRVWDLNIGIAIDINSFYLPNMIAQKKWGRIVHFSSNATILHTGAPAYTAAKHAVEGYVRRMGRMHADTGVVISAVRPGPIFTPGQFMYGQSGHWTREFWEKYVPAKRWGKPEELASVVAFLCSDGASFMPGAIVDCDGGMR